jgi:hypothetical protein
MFKLINIKLSWLRQSVKLLHAKNDSKDLKGKKNVLHIAKTQTYVS